MKPIAEKRLLRLARPPSFQAKAGFFVLLAATLALSLSLSMARDRLARNQQAKAGADNAARALSVEADLGE